MWRATACCTYSREGSATEVFCLLVKTLVAQGVITLLESSVNDFTWLQGG